MNEIASANVFWDRNVIESYIQKELVLLLGDEMPHQGILAGQGVTALALSYLWGKAIPVETLDLYKDWPDEEIEDQEPIYYSSPSLDSDSYQCISQNGFSVLTSDSKGILTSHVIQRCQANFGKDRTLVIIHALDLNAFGVGYDCYSQRIYFTTDFVEFTRSKQLRIQSPVSAQSLLLLLKFQQVYDCYIDIEEEIDLLTGFRAISNKLKLIDTYCDSISAQGMLIYNQFRKALKPYCSLVELEQPVLPGLEVPMGLQYHLVFRADGDTGHYDRLINPMLQKNNVRLDSYAFTVHFNASLRKCSSNATKNRLKVATTYSITASMVLLTPEFLQDDFTEKHAKVIEEFNIEHPFCVRTLMALNLSIIKMYKAICLIRAYSKKNGNHIIGLIETHKRIGYKLEDISRSSFERLLETYRTTAGVPLIENKADLSSFEYRDAVVELTTTTDLEFEGWRMNNCVGGYAAILQSNGGRTRIFHIDGLMPSTAAIYYEEERRDVSYEVYGHSNRDALQEHLIVAERLGRYLINSIWNRNKSSELESSLVS